MAAQTYTLACPATTEVTVAILLQDNEIHSTGYDADVNNLIMNIAEVMACFEIGKLLLGHISEFISSCTKIWIKM